MSPAQRVREALLAASAVSDLVATRIYPQVLPQNVTFPAVVALVVDTSPQSSMNGDPAQVLARARVQVDCYAKDYDTAYQVADAVVQCLESLPGEQLTSYELGRRDLYETETKLHRVSIDFDVWSGR